MNFRLIVSLCLFPLVPTLALAQRKEALIVFKDGFSLHGKVVERRDFIIDPGSGQSFTIPLAGGLINLDDQVRRLYFIPGQLQEVLEKKNLDRDHIEIKRYGVSSRGDSILPGWEFESVTNWNSKWERSIKVNVSRANFSGTFDMDQRIIFLNPHHLHIQTLKYNWDLLYLTNEFGPALTRNLLQNYYADKKEMKEPERRTAIAKFMHQAGWHAWADKELEGLVNEHPEQKEAVKTFRETIRKVQSDLYVESIERASKVGQHEEAQEKIEFFDRNNLAKDVNQPNLLLAQDLKTKYEGLNEKIRQSKTLLKELPRRLSSVGRTFWATAADLIHDDVNHDTLARLDTFLTFAQQHQREIEEKKGKLTQSTEEVLALALTGWALGNASADTDVKNARMLFRARAMLLDYQRMDEPIGRSQLLASFQKEFDLPIDQMSRIIRLLPPPEPYDKEKINTEITKLQITVPDSAGGTYYLQLPPNYHHNRPYPVLVLLHSPREKPEVMMSRFTDLAAQHGFILAAPLWSGGGFKTTYNYSAKEHAVVLDCLRDLRRRFQPDPDRTFLMGWEQGAEAALDIGLGHPDQFAGILSMNGNPKYYWERCWPNAQYLPLYLIEGDRNGNNPKNIRTLFKDFVRSAFPALYVEYKGRGSEWYNAELPQMFDWMSRKKRHHPAREMGRYHTGGLTGEEFKTMRESDNRFYFLSTDSINERNLNTTSGWVRTTQPATLQANVSVGNELDVKSGGGA